MLENATRICEAKFGTCICCDGEAFRIAATHNAPPATAEHASSACRCEPGHQAFGRMVADQAGGPYPDLSSRPGYIEREPELVAGVELGGIRTLLVVPMLKEDELVGAIAIYRQEVRPVHRQADRAGSEFRRSGRHRHREHAPAQRAARIAAQQTATADVLKVISRSTFDLQAVLDTLVESAARLCEADMADVSSGQMAECFVRRELSALGRIHRIHGAHVRSSRDAARSTGRALLEGKVVHIPDV